MSKKNNYKGPTVAKPTKLPPPMLSSVHHADNQEQPTLADIQRHLRAIHDEIRDRLNKEAVSDDAAAGRYLQRIINAAGELGSVVTISFDTNQEMNCDGWVQVYGDNFAEPLKIEVDFDCESLPMLLCNLALNLEHYTQGEST